MCSFFLLNQYIYDFLNGVFLSTPAPALEWMKRFLLCGRYGDITRICEILKLGVARTWDVEDLQIQDPSTPCRMCIFGYLVAKETYSFINSILLSLLQTVSFHISPPSS